MIYKEEQLLLLSFTNRASNHFETCREFIPSPPPAKNAWQKRASSDDEDSHQPRLLPDSVSPEWAIVSKAKSYGRPMTAESQHPQPSICYVDRKSTKAAIPRKQKNVLSLRRQKKKRALLFKQAEERRRQREINPRDNEALLLAFKENKGRTSLPHALMKKRQLRPSFVSTCLPACVGRSTQHSFKPFGPPTNAAIVCQLSTSGFPIPVSPYQYPPPGIKMHVKRVPTRSEILVALAIGCVESNPGPWRDLLEAHIITPGHRVARFRAYGRLYYFNVGPNHNLLWVDNDGVPQQNQPPGGFSSPSSAVRWVLRTVNPERLSASGWAHLEYFYVHNIDCMAFEQDLVDQMNHQWIKISVLRRLYNGERNLQTAQRNDAREAREPRNYIPRASWDGLLSTREEEYVDIPTEDQIALYRQRSTRGPLEEISEEELIMDIRRFRDTMGPPHSGRNQWWNKIILNKDYCVSAGIDPRLDWLMLYRQVVSRGGMQLRDVSVDDLWVGRRFGWPDIYREMRNWHQAEKMTSIGNKLWQVYAKYLLAYQIANSYRDVTTQSHPDNDDAAALQPPPPHHAMQALHINQAGSSRSSTPSQQANTESDEDIVIVEAATTRRLSQLETERMEIPLDPEAEQAYRDIQRIMAGLDPSAAQDLRHIMGIHGIDASCRPSKRSRLNTPVLDTAKSKEGTVPCPIDVMARYKSAIRNGLPQMVQIPVGTDKPEITCNSPWCIRAGCTHQNQPIFRRLLHDVICMRGEQVSITQKDGSWLPAKYVYLHGEWQKMKTRQLLYMSWVDCFLLGRTSIVFVQNAGGNNHRAQLTMGAVESFNELIITYRDMVVDELNIGCHEDDYALETDTNFGNATEFESKVVGLANSSRKIHLLCDNSNGAKAGRLLDFISKSDDNGKYISLFIDEWDSTRATVSLGPLYSLRRKLARSTMISANNAGAQFAEAAQGIHLNVPDHPDLDYADWSDVQPRVVSDDDAYDENELQLSHTFIKESNKSAMYEQYIRSMVANMTQDPLPRSGLIFPNIGTSRSIQEYLQARCIRQATDEGALLAVGLVNLGKLAVPHPDLRSGWRAVKVSKALVPYLYLMLSPEVMTPELATYVWRMMHRSNTNKKLVEECRGMPSNLLRNLICFDKTVYEEAREHQVLPGGTNIVVRDLKRRAFFYFRRELEIKIPITLLYNLSNLLLARRGIKLDVIWIAGEILSRGSVVKTLSHTFRLTDLFFACNLKENARIDRAKATQQCARILGMSPSGEPDNQPRNFWGSHAAYNFIADCMETEASITSTLINDGQLKAPREVLNGRTFPMNGPGNLGAPKQSQWYTMEGASSKASNQYHQSRLCYSSSLKNGLPSVDFESIVKQRSGTRSVAMATTIIAIPDSDALFDNPLINRFYQQVNCHGMFPAPYERPLHQPMYEAIDEWLQVHHRQLYNALPALNTEWAVPVSLSNASFYYYYPPPTPTNLSHPHLTGLHTNVTK
jgi:hypothetical protein